MMLLIALNPPLLNFLLPLSNTLLNIVIISKLSNTSLLLSPTKIDGSNKEVDNVNSIVSVFVGFFYFLLKPIWNSVFVSSSTTIGSLISATNISAPSSLPIKDKPKLCNAGSVPPLNNLNSYISFQTLVTSIVSQLFLDSYLMLLHNLCNLCYLVNSNLSLSLFSIVVKKFTLNASLLSFHNSHSSL